LIKSADILAQILQIYTKFLLDLSDKKCRICVDQKIQISLYNYHVPQCHSFTCDLRHDSAFNRKAVRSGVTAMALTDINRYRFILLSNVKLGIKPLVGIDFRYNNEFRYIGLAKKCERLAEMIGFDQA
jgi:hypothetical protein